MLAALARWLLQGSGNLYSTTARRFYVPDRDLGWRVSSDAPIWIGLEAIGVMIGFALALVVGAWLIRRVERRRGARWRPARIAAWIASALPFAVPIAAFATGLGPDGARETLPRGAIAAPPVRGIEGDLARPAGRYEVVPHAGTAITARIEAGKEAFDARFAGDMRGAWIANPGDLAAPMSADISVAAASVDTGVELRSEHARTEYLYAGKFPRIGFALRRVIAARQDGPDVIVFRAEGVIALMGRQHPVEVTGALRAVDAAGATRLGLTGQNILTVQADTQLRLADTALSADADSFDADVFPIHVSLVLAYRDETKTLGVKR